MQLVRDVLKEGVLRVAIGHDQMCRQGHLGGAHRPDVQIVDAGDTRQLEIGISPMGNTRELSLTLGGLGGGWIPVTIAE